MYAFQSTYSKPVHQQLIAGGGNTGLNAEFPNKLFKLKSEAIA